MAFETPTSATPHDVMFERSWVMTGSKLDQILALERLYVIFFGSWSHVPNRARTIFASMRRSAGLMYNDNNGWSTIHNSATLGSTTLSLQEQK